MPTQTRYQRWRQATELFIHDTRVEAAIVVLVLMSVTLLLAENLLPYPGWLDHIRRAGDLLTATFVFELLLRFWVANKKSRFFRRYWIDILAVLPLVRPLRMFRVLRLYRADLLLNRLTVVNDPGLRQTVSQLTALSAISFAMVVMAAATLRMVEPGMEDFGDSLWFSVFSLVAGEPVYGEPHTLPGKTVALFIMLGGLTVFGVFVGIISAAMVARLAQGVNMTEVDLDELRGHTVVCGWNRAGVQLMRELFGMPELRARGIVLITESPKPDDLPMDVIDPYRFHHVQGDYTRIEVLERVAIREASKAILLTDRQIPRSNQDRDARTVLAALTIENLAPEIYTVAEVVNREAESLLTMAGVEEIVVGDWYAGAILASVARNRGLVHVLDELLSGGVGHSFHSLDVPDRMAGRTAGELHHILVDRNTTLVAVDRSGERFVNPNTDFEVAVGDKLVVICKDKPSLE